MTPPSWDPSTTPVFLDSSALIRRYLADRDRGLVLDAMSTGGPWVVSSLTRTELQAALTQAVPTPAALRSLLDHVRRDWEAMWEVPVDRRCLSRAAEIAAHYGLSVVDAIQLSAADRLPRPAVFVTFDRQQIPGAADLGFHIVSPFDLG